MRYDGPTGRGDTRTTLATLGLVLLSLACCGLPVLIAAGGLGAAGSLLGSPWVIGTAALVAAGGAAWLLRRHTSKSCRHREPPDSARPGRGLLPAGPQSVGPRNGRTDITRIPASLGAAV